MCTLLESSYKAALGVGLTISILLKSIVSLSCILYCSVWVISIPLVRPSSPGLPRGMSTFGLGVGWRSKA